MRTHAQISRPLEELNALACIAQCYKTAEIHAAKGERALFDWWHDQGDYHSARLALYRDVQAARGAYHFGGSSYQPSGDAQT